MAKSRMNRRQKGFSVLEMMVAMAMGLFLTAAVGSLYVSNILAFRLQDDDSRLQETVKGALDVIGYHIRLAGYVDVVTDPLTVQNITLPSNKSFYKKQDGSTDDMLSKYFGGAAQYKTGVNVIHAIKGCEGLFSSTSFTTYPWACTTSGSSSITLAYQAQASSFATPSTVRTAVGYLDSLGSYNASTGAGGDCGGNDVNGSSASPAGPLAINRFYVDATSKRLMCLGNGAPSSPKPIAEGVEEMRISYGIIPATVVTTSPMDAFVGRYVTGPNVSDWSNVLSVRVCLQFVSATQNIASSVTSYKDCSGTSQTSTDGKIRQIANATFSLRNNVLTVPDGLP